MIRQIKKESEIKKLTDVIKNSFLTVAIDMGFTEENAPTNPAFIKYEAVKESIDNGLIFYGLFEKDKMIGCIAIENSGADDVFYIERLGVLPEYRSLGYGLKLMDFAFNEIKKRNGIKVSIGIVNSNTRLKKWYEDYGFAETMIKQYDRLPFDVCFMEKSV